MLQLLGSNEASSGHQGGSSTNANTPTLDSLARDLTVVARENRLILLLDVVKKFNVIEVLSRRTKQSSVNWRAWCR